MKGEKVWVSIRYEFGTDKFDVCTEPSEVTRSKKRLTFSLVSFTTCVREEKGYMKLKEPSSGQIKFIYYIYLFKLRCIIETSKPIVTKRDTP